MPACRGGWEEEERTVLVVHRPVAGQFRGQRRRKEQGVQLNPKVQAHPHKHGMREELRQKRGLGKWQPSQSVQ